MKKNSHCSFCGSAFEPEQPWPRTCAACHNTSFVNPLPVAVVVVPVGEGVLAIRRGIEPRKGQLALPGGFIDVGERWQDAGAREVFEETGVRIDPGSVSVFDVLSAPDGTVLIFGLAAALDPESLPPFELTNETSQRVVLSAPEPLAFPLHTQVLEAWFARQGRA